jgi:hypothetical protein
VKNLLKIFILFFVVFLFSGCQLALPKADPPAPQAESKPKSEPASKSAQPSASYPRPMTFGDWPEDETKFAVDNPRSQFRPNESITYCFEDHKPMFTHEVRVRVVRETGEVIKEQKVNVDALSFGSIYTFHDGLPWLQPGKYRVEVYRDRDQTLMSKGTFEVIP